MILPSRLSVLPPGSSGPGSARLGLALVLLLLASGRGLASGILRSAETRISQELVGLLEPLELEVSARVRIEDDGTTRLDLEVDLDRTLPRARVRERGMEVRDVVLQWMLRNYPNLSLDEEGVVRIRTPYNLAAESVVETVAMIPPPDPPLPSEVRGHGEGAGSPRHPARPAAAPVSSPPVDRGPELAVRLGRALGLRYEVLELDAVEALPGVMDLQVAVGAGSRGPRIDRLRLKTLEETVRSVMGLVDPHLILGPGCRLVLEVTDPETGEVVDTLAHRPSRRSRAARPGSRIAGPAAAPPAPAASPPPPAPSASPAPPAPVEEVEPLRRPRSGSLRSRHRRRRDFVVVSHEDLAFTPYPITPPRGTVIGRIGARGRIMDGGNYSLLDKATNFDFETSLSFSPTDHFQYTVSYQRLRQNFELNNAPGVASPQGDSVTFSLKGRIGDQVLGGGDLAVGTDFTLRSRSDRDIRFLGDYLDQDSIWIGVNRPLGRVWNLLFALRRVGEYAGLRPYTVVSVASEHHLNEPLRRIWFEGVYRDLQGHVSDPYGVRINESILANVGVEFRLGEKGGLVLTYPFAFSGRHRQLELRGVHRF